MCTWSRGHTEEVSVQEIWPGEKKGWIGYGKARAWQGESHIYGWGGPLPSWGDLWECCGLRTLSGRPVFQPARRCPHLPFLSHEGFTIWPGVGAVPVFPLALPAARNVRNCSRGTVLPYPNHLRYYITCLFQFLSSATKGEK